MLRKRAGGILMHITSLPSKYGIGDLGPEAYKFADFLAQAGQSFWQILPLNYTTGQRGYSPYNCFSAFAGNPLLLSPELLYRDGLLTKKEIQGPPGFSQTTAEYDKVKKYKQHLFELVLERFDNHIGSEGYEQFKADNAYWLDDFALFMSLKRRFKGAEWKDFPKAIRDRKGKDFAEIKKQLTQQAEQLCRMQYLFHSQWRDLKNYCTDRGIRIIGDIPIYVTYDSSDVWAHPEIFKLDKNRKPKYIAGVPPDYFSSTGQLWGNPVYDWQKLKDTGYRWWVERLKHNMQMFDLVRIDHFRGLVGYWQVPASHRTARNGQWIKGPGDDFFNTLLKYFPTAPFIAEDLGDITDDVKVTISKLHLPTMKVLQFGFDGDPADNPHIPHNHVENSIVYTGTHDNNTTRGWFEKEADAKVKKRLNEYLGRKVTASQVHRQFMRLAMSSVANLSIIPAQDILGLGESARMNRPAQNKGNWLWRMKPGSLNKNIAKKLRRLTETCGRL